MSLCEFLGCDWGSNNSWWHFWKCEPCCGEPCNPISALYCLICFMCPPCALCTWSHVCASDLEQNCALVNHTLPIFLLTVTEIPYTVCSCIRNKRKIRSGVGMEPGCPGKIGDIIMTCPPCLPCTLCQICRSMDREQWDWPRKLNTTRPIVCPCRMDAP